MFSRLGGNLVFRFLCLFAQLVVGTTQCNFTKRHQIILCEEVVQSAGSLLLLIYLSGLHPQNQVIRLNIYQFHLIRGSKTESGIRSFTAICVMEDTRSFRDSRCCTLTVVYTLIPARNNSSTS